MRRRLSLPVYWLEFGVFITLETYICTGLSPRTKVKRASLYLIAVASCNMHIVGRTVTSATSNDSNIYVISEVSIGRTFSPQSCRIRLSLLAPEPPV